MIFEKNYLQDATRAFSVTSLRRIHIAIVRLAAVIVGIKFGKELRVGWN